ncbi:hypothetical protein LAZ67_1002688 [Cordylochernes scorpioides]|uniref:Peptidase A2 domain-containing protein n=1 Tax=Cordylochernes scorpioides TaxID=51811 RepID=A0ABY6JX32_9ARAC|nr:hypothetical protein LAZ67_1002688 [Cordylochernes scorpioides]
MDHRKQDYELRTTDSVDKLVGVFSKVLQQQQKVIVKSTMGDTTLPHFDGAVERWIEFKEEFNRTTSEHHISDSQNLIRLRKALSGKAYDHVKHLIPYVANVKLIMEALEQQFGQPRFIIKNLLRTVKDCRQLSVQKPDTILGLNISVKGLISSCMRLTQPQYLDSIELLDTLTRKLPAEMKEQWYAWILTSNRQETLFDFSNWLDFKAKLAIRWVEPKTMKAASEEKKYRPKQRPGVVNVPAGEGTEKNKHYSCPACSDRHTLSKCDRWKNLDLNQKWKIIKHTQPSLCTSCLRQERHRSWQCLKKDICDINGCEKIHHRSLHNHSAPQGVNSRQETSKLSSSQQANPMIGSVNITVVNGEAVIKGCDDPLPIIPVVIKGPGGKHRTYALLDTGASRTLISKGLADSVGLEGKSHHYSNDTASGETVMEPNAKKHMCSCFAVVVNCEVAGTFHGAPYLPMQTQLLVSLSSDVECGRKSDKLIRKISQPLLPEKKFETFVYIERCVMVVWKAAKLWRDKTQRKRPRLRRPLTRLLNLEDLNFLNRLVCRAGAVQKAARFWYKNTFHKSGELNPPWKAAMENNKVRQHSFTVGPEEYINASLMGLFASKFAFSKPTRLSRASPVIPEMGQLPHYRLAAY